MRSGDRFVLAGRVLNLAACGGLALAIAGTEAAAVAPAAVTPATKIAVESVPAKSAGAGVKKTAAPVETGTRVAALPATGTPAVEALPPTPRIKPGALTDKPKINPGRPATAAEKAKEPAAPAQKAEPKSKEVVVFGADPKVPLSKVAAATAQKHGVDPHLVNAVILAESLYNPKALSHKGAMGLMQLIPKTAARYGVKDAWNPKQNIDGGVRYLRDLLRMFDNDIELTLAAYNAGEKAVERYGREIPPYQETQTYVARATAYMAKLQDGTTISRLKTTGAGIGGGGLSGWGVIFGSFPNAGEARMVVSQHRGSLRGVISGGRGAVVSRQHESLRPYAALLVGLDQDRAIRACKHVGQAGGYCLAIPPEQLRDPKAVWR